MTDRPFYRSTVEMPTLTFSDCLRSIDPCANPPQYQVRDRQYSLRKGDTTDVPIPLIIAMIEYMEDGDLAGDPSVGIQPGPQEQHAALKLALDGETHGANCDGTGIGPWTAEDQSESICPDCDSSGRQTMAAWKNYWNPNKKVSK